MSAAPDYAPRWPAEPPADLAGLLAAAEAAVGRLTAGADLAGMADSDVAPVMGALTTLVARLDGLRVGVAQAVAERGLYGQRGARNLAGWLRADARVADEIWKLSRLAVAGPRLPRIMGLLGTGEIGLSQAATACWQITHLPEAPRCPDQADPPAPVGSTGVPGPVGAPGVPGARDVPGAHDGGEAGQEGALGEDPQWAGLWRLGDVHAAADELFSSVLPRLDSAQLRQLGAHLREAADAQQRAQEDYGDFARRGLRISRSLGGCGEITGRLHAEAAEQVIAAFDELGIKTGPDDPRTKAQRWADALTRLAATAAQPTVHAEPLIATEPPGQTEPSNQAKSAGNANPSGDADAAGARPSPGGTGHGHDGGQAAGGQGSPVRAGTVRAGTVRVGTVPAGFQRPRLIVTVPLATLLRQPLAPGATILGPGTPLTAETARRLACDAQVIRLITAPQASQPGTATGDLRERLAAALAQLPPPLARPSAVLDIGRASPGWTPRQRDALAAQHGGHCAHPGCTGPIDVIHHLVHWADGGPTSLTNGYPACHYHHWLIHEGGWRAHRHPGGTITAIPPPPGWQPGTIYRHGKPLREHASPPDTS